ncbi:MAG: hypothetical protein ACI9FJ_000466 [Alteromonadaceae bacterium]|jgi:uncharacterized protein
MLKIVQQLATELSAEQKQVQSAIALLDEGSTVPFIARYRKEATGGLDDTQLRKLEQRLGYIRELEERRAVILNSIEEQGKLTASLSAQISSADSKTVLEDIYLPYRPKRRTKGQIAIEAGLQSLSDNLYNQNDLIPEDAAVEFINADKGFATVEEVLEGAKSILVEHIAEDATLINKLRTHLVEQGFVLSRVVKAKEQEKTSAKFRDYFDHSEKLKGVPSHRALAMLRGRNEGVLTLKIGANPQQEKSALSDSAIHIIQTHLNLQFNQQATDEWLKTAVQASWKKKLAINLETEQLGLLKEKAENEAIDVFAKNLKDVLMAAPAGAKTTMGLDPGLRTGVKVAIVDQTGKFVSHCTIFPHAPQKHWDKALRTLGNLCRQFKIELIAIGNGTASRETDKLAGELIAATPELKMTKVMVSEAGASVYSASEFAANEFPDVDVSIRGAISIARRLQDPQAELVKIEAKAIGVGQYQHDVSQNQLANMLSTVVEDCVNAVGVNLNMASVPLLARVSGLNKTLAQNIVSYRDEHGRFNDRKELKKVKRLGPKAYEQCAGFLRIAEGDNLLDASGVHPESYAVVERVLNQQKMGISDLIGNSGLLKTLDAAQYTDQTFGLPTVTDILAELNKPGRDPRPQFKTATFKEGVEGINDLTPGMILEGVVSNVASFGAFVDIGVHQDGLVHISSLSEQFVADPREVVKAGDIVKVKVLEVDVQRKRINLTMRMNEELPTPSADKPEHSEGKSAVTDNKRNNNGDNRGDNKGKPQNRNNQNKDRNKAKAPQNAMMGNAFADAFAKLKK